MAPLLALALLPLLARAGELETGGSVGANAHLGVFACEPAPLGCPWLEFQDLVVVQGHAEGDVGEHVHFRVAGRYRMHQQAAFSSPRDQSELHRLQPWTADLLEGWVERLGEVADLRVGQQRIAWGTADGYNPVDVINPLDLSDPTRFDRRLGIPAARLALHHRQAILELVAVPVFRPARLPAATGIMDQAERLFEAEDLGSQEVEVRDFEARTAPISQGLQGASMGARASVATPAVDLAASFYYGRDSLPNLGGEVRLVGFGDNEVDVGLPFVYPRLVQTGLEARGALPANFSAWFEGALVFPQELLATSSEEQLQALADLGIIDEVPDPLPETTVQELTPYLRHVLGIERFFGPVLINLQWIRGLGTERSAPDLRNYAALAAVIDVTDRTSTQMRLITDGKSGFLAGTDIEILHADALTLSTGVTVAMGHPRVALGGITGASNVHIGVEFPF